MRKQKKFRYIEKEKELLISVGNDWETWNLRIGFEVGNSENMRNRIKFDEEILQQIKKLLWKANNNALFNEFELDKKKKK